MRDPLVGTHIIEVKTMQKIKAIAAGVGGLLMAGATLMTPVLAEQTIGQAFSSMNPENTIVVVGQNAKVSDVVGAIAVAAELGQHGATVTGSATQAAAEVSGGVALYDANTKLYMGDPINEVKNTLTAKDLPNILKKGTLEDDDGNTYDYSQYLHIGSNDIEFKQEESDKDPVIAVQMSTSDSAPLYTYELDFNKEVDFTKQDDNRNIMAGNTLDIGGTTFTIGSETTSTQLVLYKASQTITLNAGGEKTVNVNGQSYDVKVIGFDSNNDEVVLNVNGATDSVREGNSRKIGGLEIYAKTVTSWNNGADGVAVLQVGSEKVTLEDGQPVMLGDNEDEVDGTEVHFVAGDSASPVTTLSTIKIDVYAPDSDNDYIAEGSSFTDPVFGTFKLRFDSVSPELKDNSRDEISMKNDGDTKAYVSFKDQDGTSRTLYFAKLDSGSLKLEDNNGYNMYLYEGANVTEDDVIALNPGDSAYTHLVKVDRIKTDDTDGYVEFKDELTGDTYKTREGKFDAANDELDLIVDGKTYKVYYQGTDANGNNYVTVNYPDNKVEIYPTFKLNDGEELAITGDLTGLNIAAGSTLVLPTGTLDTSTLDNGTTNTVTVGNVKYKVTTDSSNNVIEISLYDTSNPAVLLREEEDDNNVQNAVIVPTGLFDSNTKVGFDAPIYTASTKYTDVGTANDDITAYLDYYGTYAEYDQTDDNHPIVNIWYPDTQMYAKLAIGSNPEFGAAAASSGTVNFKPVTPSIAKMDSEVSSSDKASKNLILVGGPAINSLVAELADEGKTLTLDQWRSDYVNKAIVQVVDDAFANGEVALVVAGYSAQDTRNAVSKLISGAVNDKSAVVISGDTVSDLNLQSTTSSTNNNTTGAGNETASTSSSQ